MSKTIFNISFIENNEFCDRICFYDLSEYNSDIAIESPVVKILAPDNIIAETFTYKPKVINIFDTYLTDGLYTIEISICPNDKLKKTYYYFKTCLIMQELKNKLCQFSGNKEKVLELIDMYKYIHALKLIAENEPKKAVIMYKYIKNKIFNY